MNILQELADLFPGYDYRAMDEERSKQHIILTVLARGSWEQIQIIFRYYGTEKVRDIYLEDFRGLRILPEPAAMLWGQVFLSEKEQKEYMEWMSTPANRWRPRRTTGSH